MTILKHYRRGDILHLLNALTLIFILLSSTVFGWIPRLQQRYGFHNSSSSRRILLSFANKSNDDNDEHVNNKSDNLSSSDDTRYDVEDDDRLPLFTSEVDHQASVLKLEAIFNYNTQDKSTSLVNSKDRVVLDSWMDWPCKGDSCGDELEVSIFFLDILFFLYCNEMYHMRIIRQLICY